MQLKLHKLDLLTPLGHGHSNSGFNLIEEYGLEHGNYDAFGKYIKTLTTSGNTLAANDAVFFSPWSEVPRYKFNEYAKQNPGLSRVISVAKATAVVIEPERIVQSIAPYPYAHKYYKIPKTALQYSMNLVPGRKYDSLPEFLYVTDSHVNYVAALIPVSQVMTDTITLYRYRGNSGVDQYEDRIDTINEITAGNKKLLSDTAILEEINQGTVIDDEMYEQLSNMLKASDRETFLLALDVLANSDYKKSELKVLTLLNKYRARIGSDSSITRVNFKSFLNFFSKYGWNQGDITFAQSIVENTKPDAPDCKERLDFVKKRVLDYIRELFDKTSFDVTEVVIKTK
jgi:hypothetical protein